MNILGISCFYHDSAAALIKDGILVAAAHEERFTRKKHDQDFPTNAIRYCMQEGGIQAQDLDYIGFYDKPFTKFERILTTYVATFPKSLPSFLKAMPIWLKEKLWIPQKMREELGDTAKLLFVEHHLSHAASAFFVSPFTEAAILTADGVGEWETTTMGIGNDKTLTLTESIHFPHSLGLLYSAFTYYLGFRVNSAEYKVMGLAPYGKPVFADLILKELVSLKDDGSFRLNMKYFAYDYGLTMTNNRFHNLFGVPPRTPESALTQFHKDVAASIQYVTDEIMLRMTTDLHKKTGSDNLCLAGGVALNCVSNSKVLASSGFKKMFIQPAAGDAGGSVGAAFYIYNMLLKNERTYTWSHNFLGPEYSDETIEQVLNQLNLGGERLSSENLLKRTAQLIADQQVVGWFQGRMEFGPRSLGARSILADARNPENYSRVNLKIKFRESFRPFAPTVILERMKDYFEFDQPSPYMLFVAQVRPDRRTIPAVTHVDGSARLQTITRDDHPLYYDLIGEFEKLTNCPVIINTSFNVRGEPIVCTPFDAIKCFLRTDMDYLILGSFILDKRKIKESGYQMQISETFALD
ncbi:MAG: carbamoyltransferase [Ignavibacteriales bacterium]|nr:carbamoyltransferase [Ignavibacteriales bacterium]